MVRQPVKSSNIASVGFDQASNTLEIEFIGGGVYQYTGGQAKSYFEGILAAESPGKYFSKMIRPDKTLTVSKVA